jgi:hypothetical protein
VPNLVLAGDYVRNSMNVATMESACETGRRAAQAILDAGIAGSEPVDVIERWTPPENKPFRAEDDRRFRAGGPHPLDFPWPSGRAGGLRDGELGLRDLLP